MKKVYIRESKVVATVSNLFMAVAALMALLPFILLLIASLTDNTVAAANGFSFFPKEWSLDAYLYIANKWDTIGRAYLMTVLVTVLGTSLSLIVTSLFAYGLSNPNIPFSGFFNFLVIFSMLFNGGLVATYYTYVNFLHVRNTIWGLILPGLLMSPFNIILIKNYFRNSVPQSILEAARIDGAGEFYIFFKIVLPLSLPILATIGLMTGINYWNNWQNGLYYLTQRGGSHLYTIQIVLNTINENLQYLASSSNNATLTSVTTMPSTTARMAIAVIGILPVIIAYPFFQKFFVKGITLGGVKE